MDNEAIFLRLSNVVFEPGTWLMLAFVTWVQVMSSYRSQSFSLTAQKQAAEEAESSVLTMRLAIAMPIIGSLVLLALFFFLNLLYVFLIILLTFSCFTSVMTFMLPLVQRVRRRWFPRISELQSCTIRSTTCTEPFVDLGVGALVAAVFITLWLVTHHWLPLDFLVVALSSEAIRMLRLPSLAVATVMLSCFFVYDVFWVFISPLLFSGKSVMVEVAVGVTSGSDIPLPLLLIVPKFANGGVGMLGVGDIVLPGLLLALMFRTDYAFAKKGLRAKGIQRKVTFYEVVNDGAYFLPCLFGYVFGLIFTLGMLAILNTGQPALLYLVPSTLLPAIIVSLRRGEFGELWRGQTKRLLANPEGNPVEGDDFDEDSQQREIADVNDNVVDDDDEEIDENAAAGKTYDNEFDELAGDDSRLLGNNKGKGKANVGAIELHTFASNHDMEDVAL